MGPMPATDWVLHFDVQDNANKQNNDDDYDGIEYFKVGSLRAMHACIMHACIRRHRVLQGGPCMHACIVHGCMRMHDACSARALTRATHDLYTFRSSHGTRLALAAGGARDVCIAGGAAERAYRR